MDKTVIISGGSRGIGRALVKHFSRAGDCVYYTSTAAGDHFADFTAQDGRSGAIHGRAVDARDTQAVRAFVREAAARTGTVDILVNNAGITRDRSLLAMSDSEWEDVIGVNLTGCFTLTRAVIAYMLKQRRGRIVTIGSISGINGLPGQTNYSASKAGLTGFTRALAKEVAPYGICVNLVAPGAVETDMLRKLPEQTQKELLADVPARRFCTTGEVAQTVAFLADSTLSPDYLTGQVIALDGGMGLPS